MVKSCRYGSGLDRVNYCRVCGGAGTLDTKQLLLIPTLVITSGQPPASREVNDIGVEEMERQFYSMVSLQ